MGLRRRDESLALDQARVAIAGTPAALGVMNVVDWLLDSDAAVRWQTMRDLTDASEDDVAAENARVAADGWGARLLALRANG